MAALDALHGSVAGHRGGGYDGDSPVSQRTAQTTSRRGTLLRESCVRSSPCYLGYVSARLLANGDVDQARRQRRPDPALSSGWLHLDFEAAQIKRLRLRPAVWLARAVSRTGTPALHYLVTPASSSSGCLLAPPPGPYGRARNSAGASRARSGWSASCSTRRPRREFVAGCARTALAAYADIGWWSAHASVLRGFGQFTNELAAMPSLHCRLGAVGGLGGGPPRGRPAVAGRCTWPSGTPRARPTVVVVTGNHWTLDVVVGWAVAVAGIALSATPFGRLVDDRIAARRSWAAAPTGPAGFVVPRLSGGAAPAPGVLVVMPVSCLDPLLAGDAARGQRPLRSRTPAPRRVRSCRSRWRRPPPGTRRRSRGA